VIDALPRGGQIKILSFTVAAWFRYLTGEDDQGRQMPIIDPLAETLQEQARRGRRDAGVMLSLSEIFGKELVTATAFVDEVQQALHSFYDKGVEATLIDYARS
jgi:mannitol 2-dehydrogenase